ncbi:MAG: LCP family protein [Turicibacter sp.]|nr:LCP family protein [Turicibacter sp.]
MSEQVEIMRENEVGKDKKRRRKKSRRRVVLLVLAIILIPLAIFLIDLYRRLNMTFDEMYQPLSDAVVDVREAEGLPPIALGDDPISILILGLDDGRSDAMMVATVNPNLGTTYLLSIARDTMVPISGHWSTTRINHAFAYGGIDMAVNTVQDFLNIPIDYHVTLHMNEFPTLVDSFGGVRVYNDTVEFSMGGYHFPMGYNDLSGSSAFYYARMRFDDPRGDFGRQERQRDILAAMINEVAGVTVITRYQQILDATSESMLTNVSLNEMLSISVGYNRALRNITNLTLHAPGQLINGMYLIPIPEEQRLEMSNRLRAHLELD